MAVSVFDLFSIGIGPSSSHTVGPMRAAQMFAKRLEREGLLPTVARVRAELFGSLGATGHGHGSPKAVLLGLEGHRPADVDVRRVEPDLARIRDSGRLWLLGAEQGETYAIGFDQDRDLVLHRRKALPYHPNGLQLSAFDADGAPLAAKTYYSVGGGFVVDDDAVGPDRVKPDDTVLQVPVQDRGRAAAADRGHRALGVRADAGERARLARTRPRCGRGCSRSGG